MLSREEALAARWLHEPQPISNQPVGLEFAHFTKRYRLEGSAFSSPESWSCRDMDGFLIRGWEMVLPGCGGTSILSREATIGARWLHEPQPISNQSVRWGLYAARGGIDPGDLRFRPRVVGVVDVRKDF